MKFRGRKCHITDYFSNYFINFLCFFSSAETALTTVNKIRMRTLADDGNKRAERVLRITDDSHKMLSAILIGNNIVNLSASSLATTLAIKLWGSVGARYCNRYPYISDPRLW